MSEVYSPSDDSYFFSEFLKKYFSEVEGDVEYLDMGTGSGILAETVASIIGKEDVLAVDSNPDAVSTVRGKGLNAVVSDLFSNISGSFDVISFNAPYLPHDRREPEDSSLITSGGKNGDELSVRFLEGAKKHLNPGGRIFLLVSSLTPRGRIDTFDPLVVGEHRLPRESLYILEFR